MYHACQGLFQRAANGKTVAVCFGKYVDNGVRLWDVSTGKELPSLGEKDNQTVYMVAFSPDGLHLATGDGDTIRIWDWAAGTKVTSFHQNAKRPNGSETLAYSPDGKTLLLAGNMSKEVGKVGNRPLTGLTRIIQLMDAATGQVKMTLESIPNTPVLAPVFSPNGKLLAYGSQDKALVIVDVATGTKISRIEYNADPINAVFSGDSARLLGQRIKSWTFHEWDVATGKELRNLGTERPLNKAERPSEIGIIAGWLHATGGRWRPCSSVDRPENRQGAGYFRVFRSNAHGEFHA